LRLVQVYHQPVQRAEPSHAIQYNEQTRRLCVNIKEGVYSIYTMTMLHFRRILSIFLWLIILVATQQRSDYDSTDPIEQVRAYTRWEEFDYTAWMGDALALKISFGVLNLPHYLDEAAQHQVVLDHLRLISRLNQVGGEIGGIFADPSILDPEAAAADLLREQALLKREINRQSPIVEAILQKQISVVTADLGLGVGGQLLPPLLYHVTPLPMALIISPRTVIQQVADISVQPDLPLAEITRLEDAVGGGLNVSALVVPVGGVGVYPTMVQRTTDINWLVETVAHEWIHNYLTLRPLGALYFSTPQMRTINETTANIAGGEIGAAVIARFYPEFKPTPPPEPSGEPGSGSPSIVPEAPVFDYRAEMHETRVTADELLAEGKVQEAEAYMEARRQVFWDNGYQIRRLNQAYFAFYGSYADQPGGAAGEDPVGEAVRTFRNNSLDLSRFIKRISWVVSFEGLERLNQRD